MSDQPRRRLRPAPTPRRVGEPNVLSNQATPNQLSTMGTPGRSQAPAMAPTQASTRPATATLPRPTIATGRPTVPPESRPARTRRLPSLGTLITIGFVLFWAMRIFDNLGGTSSSKPTAQPPPPGGITAGVVTFGTGLGEGCELENVAENFELSVDVWWRAELTAPQAEEVTVVVRAYRDEGQFDRYEIPPEDGTGRWEILCGGDPVAAYQAGAYRVEIWDEAEHQLLAVGEYSKSTS